ncbi:glycosyl hydrolase family 61-domain-containing protein [Pterulicium gracile]|uniref:lytic cellulose monooxygenase (C4-dehydrogenating) n=1 Tax=Pterulicium gracile TaxID=1884261 RepID=A0A5C3Q253_9AGAR|nr:glycosyl hydrolase family 61-domain-containing protein [Pterula gracilis]
MNYMAKRQGTCSSWKGDSGSPWFKLLRHEILALHGGSSVNGAQFYPVCVQLTVTGGGSLNPSGLSFPGTYKQNDPGILFNVYQGDAVHLKYVPPGGPIASGLQF